MGAVHRDLVAEALRQNVEVRRGLWRDLEHAVLFYTAGYAVRDRIAGYTPYADAWGPRERAPELYELLDAHWGPWLVGRIDYETAIRRIVQTAAR